MGVIHMNEFDIIKQYFATQSSRRDDVVVGIGDDAAIVNIPQGHELIVTTDTLIRGVHFPVSTLPYDIGYKSLAVNLSDLAAMGATPAWVTMTLTLPDDNREWLQAFCEGFFTLANRHRVELIGGDLTHGPLSITVQAMGFTPPKKALLRSQAKPGDAIYVTGTIGDAGLALRYLQNKITLDQPYQRDVLERLNRPEPRIACGEHLRDIASAAIDISDGLAADLSHILEQSQVGAILYVDSLPLSAALTHSLSHQDAIALALTAGDDYELCFTVPAKSRAKLEEQLSRIPCQFTCIGEIRKQSGLELNYQNGSKYHGPILGYQHF
jgi:thiamine-monophosphate kinase